MVEPGLIVRIFHWASVPLDLRRCLTTVHLTTLGDSVEILPEICYLPTPGHSIDHAAISITSEGETAIFGGDVLHVDRLDFHGEDPWVNIPGSRPRSSGTGNARRRCA